MRKGVAVRYVVALILGVAVIGLVGFWIAATGGKFSGQSQSTYCQNEALKWCTQKLIGQNPTFNIPGCNQPNDCASVVGKSPTSGGSTPPDPTPVTEPTDRAGAGDICDNTAPSDYPSCDFDLRCCLAQTSDGTDNCNGPTGTQTGNCYVESGRQAPDGLCGSYCVSGRCSVGTICD